MRQNAALCKIELKNRVVWERVITAQFCNNYKLWFLQFLTGQTECRHACKRMSKSTTNFIHSFFFFHPCNLISINLCRETSRCACKYFLITILLGLISILYSFVPCVLLTLSQTTNFGLFKTVRVCRQQF